MRIYRFTPITEGRYLLPWRRTLRAAVRDAREVGMLFNPEDCLTYSVDFWRWITLRGLKRARG